MSDAPPETPKAAPPPPPPPTAPTPARAAPLRLDPAAVMIGVGGVVLLLALWWLWATPRAEQAAAGDERRLSQIEQRLAALDPVREQAAAANARLQALPTLEARVNQLPELEGRLRTLESRPAPPDIRPLESQTAALTERLAAAERGAAQATDRAGANERRLQALEGRPAFDPAAAAPRAALDALAARTERLTERVEAVAARVQGAEAEATRRAEEAARAQGQRIEALERQVAERAQALEQQAAQRAQALEQQASQRAQAVEQQVAQRLQALEQQGSQRLQALESALGQRIAAVEQAQQRLAAIEGRTARLAAVDGLRAALSAGQPLGPALARVQDAPAALARFGGAAPPTEAALRLSFEEAAKAARAASDAAATGPEGTRAGVVDSALARLGGLVTVRRGDQVVWGDAAEAEIERARRALEAGDLELALSHIEQLPPAAREAMRGWTDQARALVAARAALRQLATAGG
jgi:hypothetical protein